MNFKTVASVFAAVTALIAQSAMAQAPVEGKEIGRASCRERV